MNKTKSALNTLSSTDRKPRRRNRARGNGSGTLFKRGDAGPWYLGYYDDRGKRTTRSSGTTDKATAQAILNKHLVCIAKRREGIIDHADAIVIDAGRRPIAEHVEEYIADC